MENISFLFVCSGNTCRSVMAEAFFQQHWEVDGLPGRIQVCSAGLAVFAGLPPSEEALTLLRGEGLEMGQHRSRPVNGTLMKKANYVFTMTAVHKQLLLEQYPLDANKIWRLGEYSGAVNDIVDPYGGGMDAYNLAAIQIKKAIVGLMLRLKQEIRSQHSE